MPAHAHPMAKLTQVAGQVQGGAAGHAPTYRQPEIGTVLGKRMGGSRAGQGRPC